jgi:carboxylesterase type B
MNCWVTASKSSVVAVNLQYRLGLLGFLVSSEVMADGSANVGSLARSTRRVRVGSEFGGDLRQVTVIGERTGAGDFVFRMMAYEGVCKPLF